MLDFDYKFSRCSAGGKHCFGQKTRALPVAEEANVFGRSGRNVRLGTSRRDYGHRKRAYKAELIIAETNKIE